MSGKEANAAAAARADQLSRLTDALEILARRWQREARDPSVARILRDRYGSATAELVATCDVLASRIDTASEHPSAFSPALLLRLEITLGALAELAKPVPAAAEIAAPDNIVDIQSRFRVKRLDSSTQRLLKKLVRILAACAFGAASFAALPAAAVSVGDLVTNPDTGLNETVVEVLVPEIVATADHYILLATTVGDTFTDPETGTIFTVDSVTTNGGGFVTEVTVKDADLVFKTITVVTDIVGGADTPDADSGLGTDDFTFTPAISDLNNYVNSKTGKGDRRLRRIDHRGGDDHWWLRRRRRRRG